MSPFLGHDSWGSSVHLTHEEWESQEGPRAHPQCGWDDPCTPRSWVSHPQSCPPPAAQILEGGSNPSRQTFPLSALRAPWRLFFQHPSPVFASKRPQVVPGAFRDHWGVVGVETTDMTDITHFSLLVRFSPCLGSTHPHRAFWKQCRRPGKKKDRQREMRCSYSQASCLGRCRGPGCCTWTP